MKKVVVSMILIIVVLTTGCSKEVNQEKDLSLSIGIMPAVDSAPILLAEKKGYFEKRGLDMDIQIYTNAVNRQTALQSGKLDGAMTDLIAFVNNVDNDFEIKITTSTDGSFPFLVSKDFTEKDKIKIGMMEVSVSNFLSEQFLKDDYIMEKIFIPEIPTRLEMIVKGKMDMAIIPEPLASMGELRGLEKRVYQNKDDFMPEAMIFTEKAIAEKEEAIKQFHQAYNQAIDDILADEELARQVLIEKLELKPAAKDLITLPDYHHARLPDQAYLNKVINWVEEVQGSKIDLKYEEMVEGKFIK